MAPSDSQHPEIGDRQERGEEEKKAEKTKQNKQRLLYTGRGWAWADKSWRERRYKEEQQRKRETEREGKDFTILK